MTRNEFLKKLENVLCSRDTIHGKPEDTFNIIAKLWTDYLEVKGNTSLTRKDVALMMVLFKVARQLNGNSEDNWLDIAGYAACGTEESPKYVFKTGGKNEI